MAQHNLKKFFRLKPLPPRALTALTALCVPPLPPLPPLPVFKKAVSYQVSV